MIVMTLSKTEFNSEIAYVVGMRFTEIDRVHGS